MTMLLTLDEALATLAAAPTPILAGGTDLLAAAGSRLPGPVLDVTRIEGLDTVARTDAGWRIGAGVTWSAVAAADLPQAFDGLKQAARQVGAVQIQNTATLAGNICNASPAGDGVPALLALDAAVEITSRAGRRVLPLDAFVLGPRRTALRRGEMVSAILVPTPPEGAAGAFLKLGARRHLVISIAMVAVVLAAEGGAVSAARVAVGACSPVALRLPALEADLLGRPLAAAAEVTAPAHLAALAPIDDVRAPAQYRREAALVLVRRAIAAAARRCAP